MLGLVISCMSGPFRSFCRNQLGSLPPYTYAGSKVNKGIDNLNDMVEYRYLGRRSYAVHYAASKTVIDCSRFTHASPSAVRMPLSCVNAGVCLAGWPNPQRWGKLA